MTPPPFLLGATLLFWGWQTGVLLPAIGMAVLLESARWVDWRVDFKREDLDRVWDLCAALFLAAALYCFLSRGAANSLMDFFQSGGRFLKSAVDDAVAGIFTFFEWWPMIFFPFAVAQAFAAKPVAPLSTFSWYLRRRRHEAEAVLEREVPVGPAYYAVCLFAASLPAARAEWFFPGFALLLAWGLWVSRSPRFRPVIWLGLMVLVLKLGWWGATGLRTAQNVIENKFSNWAGSYLARRPGNRLESQTAIGTLGRLKLSGNIVLRAEPAEGSPPPSLLRDSSFQVFRSPTWFANRRDFTEVLPDNDALTWRLAPELPPSHVLRMWTTLPRGQGFLATPAGSSELGELAAGAVMTNRLGVIRVTDAPGMLQCRARWSPRLTRDAPPDRIVDWSVPNAEKPVISRIVQELQLAGKTSDQKITAINAFFLQNFRYSSYQTVSALGRQRGETPLETFLTRTRAGHCEYFGTAAVLLLREAGVPSRYANGYALVERERGSTTRYVVRERHAHAWALVWSERDRKWHDFDPTPGGWVESESENKGLWEPVSDWWSRVKFKLALWRSQQGRGALEMVLVPMLVLLVALLAWRIFRRREGRRKRRTDGRLEPVTAWPGLDSDFYAAEHALERMGFARQPGETFGAWLTRLERASLAQVRALREPLELHYRLRFDPRGLDAEGRAALKSSVQQWLARSAK